MEKLQNIDERLHGLSLAFAGADLASDAFLALSAILDDARDRCAALSETLRSQDARKRARGEPRVGRVFFDEQGAALAESVAALAQSVAALDSAADPIFAAIERHNALRKVYVRLLNRIDIDGEGRIDADEDQRIFERAARRDAEALNTVAKTAPTTFAGLVAALRYLADYDTETRALPRFVFTVADAYPDLTRIKGVGE
ncbi:MULTISPECIES: hypothetical protein [Methylosinus]|uniref:hypothetical protein n=1 Tax=Methylosinus TaxID=425 RepID=UPI00031F6B01|nr:MULTISPECIES: hypothetical protein [Methylosinus]